MSLVSNSIFTVVATIVTTSHHQAHARYAVLYEVLFERRSYETVQTLRRPAKDGLGSSVKRGERWCTLGRLSVVPFHLQAIYALRMLSDKATVEVT